MGYTLNFSKRAFKELAKINEPYYTSIKVAVTSLLTILDLKVTEN
jgi:mRNA-degrading endonuclease RelE of RelBE toxin-antitoxin system